ncbi:MAG: hypothetical protein HYZ17_08380 [Betaproteobacteria bacterium]|jgi:hypothetical protein|nr:hypothetical protein [Betaproteobacteria bacterium]
MSITSGLQATTVANWATVFGAQEFRPRPMFLLLGRTLARAPLSALGAADPRGALLFLTLACVPQIARANTMGGIVIFPFPALVFGLIAGVVSGLRRKPLCRSFFVWLGSLVFVYVSFALVISGNGPRAWQGFGETILFIAIIGVAPFSVSFFLTRLLFGRREP